MWLWTVIIALAASAALPEKPFWQSKEKAVERIKNREILVVVKSAPKDKGNVLLAQGGGRVNAPAEFTFQKAQEYNQLPKLSSYIDEASFDSEGKELTIKVSAYGYHGKMRIKIDVRKDAKEIGFSIVEGSLKGFNGLFWFEPISSKVSEVGLDGQLLYDQIPVPKIFLEFGMEVVLQRLAGKLRQFAEDEYKKQDKK